jgi:hypothetical protein
VPHIDHGNQVKERLNKYLDSLLDRAAERLAPRVADRVADEIAPRIREEYDAWLATIEVMADADLVSDLRDADAEGDDDAQDYAEIRRELGLA